MIKAIIFDFDGVIVESADIKTEAFKELFSNYPEKVEEIVNYHIANAGISRYVKFRYIYERILREDLSGDLELELGRRFSQLVLQQVIAAPFVTGAKEFLDRNRNRYQFFIASGTPQEELCRIIMAKGLQAYFKEVQGSPKKKTEIIKDIIGKYNLAKNQVVYVGDAESDRISAQGNGIPFIQRRSKLESKAEIELWVISDLSNLGEILKNRRLNLWRSD